MAEGQKIAVMFMGPPGVGKSYMAQMLVERLGLHHFDTGEVIKRAIFNSSDSSDPVFQKEREIYLSGKLNTDSWVTDLVVREVKHIAASGKGIVFSGSPKRMLEAEHLIPLLQDSYGKERVRAFLFVVAKKTAIERIKKRRICSQCGLSIMPDEKTDVCRLCGGAIIPKTLDDPKKIEIRFEEYKERTAPILDYFRKLEILQEINAEPSPEEIFKEITRHLGGIDFCP